jgi:hypothetical protein
LYNGDKSRLDRWEVDQLNSDFNEITFDLQLQPGEPLQLPKEAAAIVGPGHWLVSVRPADCQSGPVRDHSAFVNSFAPEDEGLYDDYSAG